MKLQAFPLSNATAHSPVANDKTGSPIDCSQSNPCSQRCIAAGTYDSASRRVLDQDRCECFAGYKLAADRVNCVDIDECKLGLHSCDKKSELCDNIRGSFRCLARHGTGPNQAVAAPAGRSLFHNSDLTRDSLANLDEFQPLRLCPPGSRWNAEERSCMPTVSAEGSQRSASLFSSSSGIHMFSGHSRLVDSQ